MYPKNDISWDLDKYVGAFNFRILVDGVPQESMKVLGISNVISESEIVEYKLGHEPYVRKIPGRSKFSEVEITRIYQGYDQMYSWRTKVEDGIEDLRNVKIEILAPDLKTVILQMVLHNCWPHRWQLPNLDASSTAPATETIALACERVTQSMATPKSVTSSINMVDATPAQIPEATDFLPPTGGAEEQDFRDNDLTKFQGDEELDFRDNDLTKFQGEGELDFRDNDLTKHVGDGKNRFKFTDLADQLASQLGDGPLNPQDTDWDPPEPGDEEQDFRDNDLTEFKGEGEQDFRDNATGINAVDDPTSERSARDGTGTIDPNEESWDKVENEFVDLTAEKQGGDGTGPVIVGNASNDTMEFADTADGSGPIGGQGEAEEADYGEGDGPIDPSQKDFGESAAAEDPTAAMNGADGDGPIDPSQKGFGDSAAADDPTAAKNGGDGSGPIGGQGAAAGADGGAGAGPIDNEKVDYGGSAAADDPTAAKNGGDGSGPVGGQGAAAEADYGSPGSGPVGGQGAPESTE
jgi:phage tail-like protein